MPRSHSSLDPQLYSNSPSLSKPAQAVRSTILLEPTVDAAYKIDFTRTREEREL